MNFRRMKTAAASLVFLFMGTSSLAQTETPQATGYVGLGVGYADPTNIDGRLGYGIDVGLMFPNGLTGVIFGRSSTGETDSVDVSILQYGLGVDYSLSGMFSGALGALKGGVKVGMSTLDVDVTGADEETGFAFGPSIGMDYPLNDMFSVGGQADLLFVTNDPGYSTLYLLVNGKYWF